MSDLEKKIKERVKTDKLKELNKYNRELEKQLLKKEKELEAVIAVKDFEPNFVIKPTKNGGKLSATAFILLSDIHYEERVLAKTVNNLNSYDLGIADFRLSCFFNNTLRLLKITSQDVKIDKIVLCLMGDMITSSLHEENLETNQLQPIDAIMRVLDIINAGIKLIKERYSNLVVATVTGNHSRLTKKIHHATEAGNSLETMLYCMLQKLNPDVEFVISQGAHLYLTVYDYKIRIMHGSQVRYLGGIGGLFIPMYRAIASWDKAIKAKLTLSGHFHQMKNGGNFITNGSVIGYNPFALSIKADFEPPQQKFFILLSNGLVSMEAPIILDII